jgi:thiol-disulfide isomerase/thioredoxin
MAKYINFNSGSSNIETPAILSRTISMVNSISLTTWMMIGFGIGFIIIAAIVYFYYFMRSKPKYYANNEQMPSGSGFGSDSNKAELLFFYADWCPHCKAAKPIWNDLKSEYENKTINGYQIIFTEVDCSEETSEVEKLMNQYSVEGYPTIKLVKDGKVIEYDAKPSKETLTKFLETVL